MPQSEKFLITLSIDEGSQGNTSGLAVIGAVAGYWGDIMDEMDDRNAFDTGTSPGSAPWRALSMVSRAASSPSRRRTSVT